jgi:tetratricopeptide (TPR) repeat protein
MRTSDRRGRRPRWACATLCVTVLLAGGPASGSERSERLSAQGLARFHTQKYDEALLLFDQAVEADPNDAWAHYYRGVCRGRVGRTDEAITDLRDALSLDPSLTPAALELGSALIQTDQYQQAIPYLEQAQQDPALAARAALFLGIAQLRLDHPEVARPALERAAEDPALATPAEYYLGLLAYREGRMDDATRHFGAVVEHSPQSSMGREAADFLQRLQQATRPWYELYAAVGLQYDSNVVLAPATNIPSLGISQQADGRVVLNAAGAVVPWQNDHARLVLGYNFFQGLQFQLHSFNLQDNRFSAEMTGQWDWLRTGVLARYSYYLLETDSFLQEVTGLPWASADEGDLGRTELYFRVRYRDFFKQPYNPQLNATDYAVGPRQLFFLGGEARYLALGYQFDRNDPNSTSGAQFGYDGNEVNVGLGWDFPWLVTAEAGYSYLHQNYDPASQGRRDNQNQVLFTTRKQLTDHFGVSLSWLGTWHNSNVAEFAYNRQIGSVIVDAAY